MSSLKLEMRQMFEKRSSMAFLENNSKFEDGLLEKIINLSFASLSAFSNERWHITAVRTPVLLQKLYKITGELRLTDSAYALIVCPEGNGQNPELFSLALSCAAKYFCVDCFIIRTFDRTVLARDFPTYGKKSASTIACLGCFRDRPACCSPVYKTPCTLKIM